jgi:hypothetical protein
MFIKVMFILLLFCLAEQFNIIVPPVLKHHRARFREFNIISGSPIIRTGRSVEKCILL